MGSNGSYLPLPPPPPVAERGVSPQVASAPTAARRTSRARRRTRRDESDCHFRKTAAEYDRKPAQPLYKVAELYCEVTIRYNPRCAGGAPVGDDCPDPPAGGTMCLEFSAPILERLNGKRQSFTRERSRKLQTHHVSHGAP
jgi:hypothetical protein